MKQFARHHTWRDQAMVQKYALRGISSRLRTKREQLDKESSEELKDRMTKKVDHRASQVGPIDRPQS